MNVTYLGPDEELTAEEFCRLASQFLKVRLRLDRVRSALSTTINCTARDNGRLIACMRVLSDGYMVGCITEVLILREYRGKGISTSLFQLAAELSPTSLFMATQQLHDEQMLPLGWKKGHPAYFLWKAMEEYTD